MKLNSTHAEIVFYRKQLNFENREYFSHISTYIKTSFITRKQVDETLLEILSHLLELQKEGTSAKQFFGSNPKEYCDSILINLEKPKIKEILLFQSFIFSSFLSLLLLLIGLFSFLDTINSVAILSGLEVYVSLLLLLTFNISILFLNKISFTENLTLSFLILLSFFILVLMILILGFVLLGTVSFQLNFFMPSWFKITFGFIGSILSFYVLKGLKK